MPSSSSMHRIVLGPGYSNILIIPTHYRIVDDVRRPRLVKFAHSSRQLLSSLMRSAKHDEGSYRRPFRSRSPRVGALQELFQDGGASKELPVPKLFRRSAANVGLDVASAPACWTSDIRTDANQRPA